MIKKYRRIVEAVKFTGNNVSEIKAFIGIKKISVYKDKDKIKIPVRIPGSSGIGAFIVRIGDYVIKANNGTIHTFTGDFFEREFEEVREDK